MTWHARRHLCIVMFHSNFFYILCVSSYICLKVGKWQMLIIRVDVRDAHFQGVEDELKLRNP